MVGFLYLVAVVALISVWAMSLRRRKAEASELRRLSEELGPRFQALLLLVENLAREKTSSGEPQPGLVESSKREDDPFGDAVDFYKVNLASLLKEWEGKHIAIVDCRVVDADADFERLALRVYEQFGYRDIFMPKVERQPRTIRLPSPRVHASQPL